MSGQWGPHLYAGQAWGGGKHGFSALPPGPPLPAGSPLQKLGEGHPRLSAPPPVRVAHSRSFLGKLLSRVRASPHIRDLCDVVHAHAVGPFSVYVDYVRNQQYQEETYSRLM